MKVAGARHPGTVHALVSEAERGFQAPAATWEPHATSGDVLWHLFLSLPFTICLNPLPHLRIVGPCGRVAVAQPCGQRKEHVDAEQCLLG